MTVVPTSRRYTHRIGILTLPLWKNYGGILQAVALTGFLESHGFAAVLIQREPRRSAWKIPLLRLIERLPFAAIRRYRVWDRDARMHRLFIERHIVHRTRFAHTPSDLRAIVQEDKLEAVVVGSDQVWRYDYIRNHGYADYFLGFLGESKIKRIAYAASFGTATWEAPEKVDEISQLIRRFSHVSVRESTGATICKDQFGLADCAVALDPTLLVTANFYDTLVSDQACKESCGANSGGLVAYMLDPSQAKSSLVEHVLVSRNATAQSYMQNLAEMPGLSIEMWISAFRAGAVVLTDSFHGMVFAIIFRKPFVVVSNPKRGAARFESLVRLLGLEDRVLSEELSHEHVDQLLNRPIDYVSVHSRLDELRAKSSDFLIDALVN